MAVNKVIYGETTVIDITDSTVTASKLKSGETAYGADGQKVTGTLVVPEVLDDLSDVVITSPETAHQIYYDGTNWINYGAKIILTFDNDFKGQTITLTKGQITITKTAPLDSNTMNLYINETGLWTISSEISGDTYETEVNVTTFGISFDAELSSVPPIPEGATVTPTDNIQTWLACANITDKAYTTLAEVLADRETFETLIADSNACDYMARSTTWALAEGLVPKMTSATTPSGQVISDSDYSGQPNWQSFDKDYSTTWTSNKCSSSSGQCYCGYIFTSEKIVQRIKGKLGKSSQVTSTNGGKFQYYNGTNWIDIPNATIPEIVSSSNVADIDIILDEPITANGIRMFQNIPKTYGTIGIYELQFYSDADITTSQDAMSLIGKYDYCSNALLCNATWADAIANSVYFKEVLNVSVPKMTSATTPSGEVIAPNQHSSYLGYYAFDQNTSTRYSPVSANTFPDSVTYDFKKQVKIVKFSVMAGTTGSIKDFQIRGSNDNNTWTTLYSGTYPNSQEVIEDVLTTIGDYRYYQIYEEQTAYVTYMSIMELQFYGRASKEVLVPLVPKMTSDTQPSGECFSSYDNSNAYLVFDGNDSTTFMGSASTAIQSFGYDFGKPVFVNKATHLSQSGYGTTNPKIKIQYSDDKSTWQDASEPVSFGASANILTTIIGNINTPHRYWRVYLYGDGGVSSWNTYTVQFYQRTVQTNIVHSCANDTIYYMEDGSPVIVATTNSDGDGVLDFSSLEDKEYTFYSSVAKDPSNLSNDFSKTIRITKSEFGGTTEMYLMPDTVKTLYWYGYIDDSKIEACTTANGWASNSYGATFNTNDIRLYSASVSQIMGIGTKNAINMSDYTKLTVINNGIATAGGTYGGCGCNATKVTNTENIGSYTTAGVNKKEWDISSKTGNQYLTIADNANTRDLKILGIILE